MKTWGELSGLRGVMAKNFPKATMLNPVCATLLYGVELEIEDVPNWEEMVVPGIRAEADGSLRNNGREFITLPMTYSNLAHCLGMFFGKNKLSENNYSERCSIHVHTNCQDLTEEQIQTIAFVYQLVEHCLFEWVDHERANNIFCVPWSQTNLTYQMFSANKDATRFRSWQKYTALNLLPLYTQGTIEWRHMNGHCNLDKILEWCQIIGCIYSYALKTPLKDVKEFLLTLNTTSQYKNILELIFQERAALFYALPDYERHLEEGVINMKYSLGNPGKAKPKLESYYDLPVNFEEQVAAVRERMQRLRPSVTISTPPAETFMISPSTSAGANPASALGQERATHPQYFFDDLADELPQEREGEF
jgi:hypothetical protein